MWWLDPGKEILHILFNRILAPYVENLDLNQVNYGIGQGLISLHNLRLKKGALDKFQLPIDVLEGYLGTFSLSLHWMNLGNQPVEILIEDVYILAIPSPQDNVDSEEEEKRLLAAKLERLESAELLHAQSRIDTSADDTKTQGLWDSLMAKIINNVQITVKRIHIRYEDHLSVPGHPFATGITLASFSAISVDDQWKPAFIESTSGTIHKLANLESLAIYFDTDTKSMAGLPREVANAKFLSMISHKDEQSTHQFILKPVSGEGRVTISHRVDKQTPRMDVELVFDEIAVALDNHQYRDAISLVDMYHVYLRRHQYRRYRPLLSNFSTNVARSRLQFAAQAILAEVHERRRKWSWAYFAERRDDRKRYINLFLMRLSNTLGDLDARDLEDLEKKLSYEDLRFYRSLARSRHKKELAAKKAAAAEEQSQAATKQGWLSWVWGSSTGTPDPSSPTFQGNMTEEQRQQLYEVLDYDEKTALLESIQTSRDSLKARFTAKLNKGTFAIKTDPHGRIADIISVVFDELRAEFIQRLGNYELSLSLGDFGVFDGITQNTLHHKIVHVKDSKSTLPKKDDTVDSSSDAFFYVKFENNPLHERADTALTVRMRPMEIIYYRGYIEEIYRFFKPPASQLESVEALLSAASQTIEGIRRETRAGLEYALQVHKTIDVQMDMNAPLIVVPEDVSTYECKHLIIDAGHISIESALASKDAIKTIHLKRNQKYTEADYRHLESLMYDRFSLRLEAAQFVVGDSLQACRDALTSTKSNGYHLLERTNIDFHLQNSIVPTAYSLTRWKVSGKLPTLQLNLSDVKYKALMRLIEVSIPHFEVEANQAKSPRLVTSFPLPQPLFRTNADYAIAESDGSDTDEDSTSSHEDQFFEAEDGTVQRPELRQHLFELDFQVEHLSATLSKGDGQGEDKPLGSLSLQTFAIHLSTTKHEMHVKVALRSVSMALEQSPLPPVHFISSLEPGTLEDTSKDLLLVNYRRIQQASPEFATTYEGIDQAVEITMSTLILRAAPQPLISLYDFIMSTFVSQGTSLGPSADQAPATQEQESPTSSPGRIRVLLKLASIQVIILQDEVSLATLSLSTADVAVYLRPTTIRVTGRLGSLSLTNDANVYSVRDEFMEILSIEGSNFADFTYQTYDPDEESHNGTGTKSSFSLNAASVKLQFLEEPLRAIYWVFLKFSKLKAFYDAATQAAVQSAPEVDRMQYEISIKSPILVFPTDPIRSPDVIVARLGEIHARNTPKPTLNEIQASLSGIQLVSRLHSEQGQTTLKIIQDIDVRGQVIQALDIGIVKDTNMPTTQVALKVSDVHLSLTHTQYIILMHILQVIPRVFVSPSEEPAFTSRFIDTKTASSSAAHVQPELQQQSQTSFDLLAEIGAVKLELFDDEVEENNTEDHGIAKFALVDNSLRYKSLADGSSEAQVVLRSFTMTNTRSGPSKFREVIPAAQHERNQFMVLYTTSSGRKPTSQVIVNIDAPQILFALDPLVALLDFFTLPLPQPTQQRHLEPPSSAKDPPKPQPSNSLDFRIDLHDVAISVLQDDTNPDTQAISLSVHQLSLSQQGITALSVSRLGMSLMSMGKLSENARFLDDVDVTFTFDSRSSSTQQFANIELTMAPVIFRASYRDINLITSIASRAMELYSNATQSNERSSVQPNSMGSPAARSSSSFPPNSRAETPSGSAMVVVSKEQFNATLNGFRLVLITDMYEQPMFHLRVKPFVVSARDWSNELHASVTLAVDITYWNLTNSHWEPLIDPWTFTITVSRPNPKEGLKVAVDSRERLDLNVSTTFMEVALMTLSGLEAEAPLQMAAKTRGTFAPYRIHNITGIALLVWSDITEPNDNKGAQEPTTLLHSQTIDWRFDDWRTLREHIALSGRHNIGIQFLGKSWEPIRGIPVDREGEYVFTLRPRNDKYPSRILCEVRVVDNVKIVTLRSTYKIENQTLYPLEVMLVDSAGSPIDSVQKVPPGHDYSLPVEAVTHSRVRLQPDQGFGYKWSAPIRWEDLQARKNFTARCPHNDSREAAFRFQVWAQMEVNTMRQFPKLNLKLRAPIELENLLPYDLEYRVYDKDTDQNWRSFLRKGGIMPVHSVELSHFVLLSITIQDTVFKASEFAIINTDGQGEFDTENRLVLQDSQSRKLEIGLHYSRYPDSGGAFKVQIYAPYIIINKTGLIYSVKSARSTRPGAQDVAGDNRAEVLTTTTPFLLSHPYDNGHEFIFRVGDSSLSKIYSFEAPSAETTLSVASSNNKADEYHIGMSWSEGVGKYKLTKDTLSFREHGVALRDRSILKPGERCPLHLFKSGQEKLLTIAFTGLNAQWSPPFNIEDLGSTYLRLRERDVRHDNHPVQLIQAHIQVEGPTIFVTFSRAEEWPYRIENESNFDFEFSQTEGEDDKKSTGKIGYQLPSRSVRDYAWDYPALKEKKLQLTVNGSRRVVDVMEIGDLVPFKFTHNQRTRAVSLDVRADGARQILRITNYSPDRSLYRPRNRSNSTLSTLSTLSKSDSSSSFEVFEAIQKDVPTTFSFDLNFSGIAISLINRKMVEVIYASLTDLKLAYSDNPISQSVALSCGVLQIDNQLHDAIYPVVIQPTPITNEDKSVAALPTIQASVTWLKDQAHGVFFVKYCSILLQALTIEADEDLLFSLYELSQVKGASWQEDTKDCLVEHPDDIPEPTDVAAGQTYYFEVLEFQPIKLSLSFMRTEREDTIIGGGPLAVVVNALTMTIGNINDAPLELNALAIKDARSTLPELQSRVLYHYRQDVIRQLYRILGSADFIGNPVGLFSNVSSGVADIFYEPYNGVVMHGNREFGIGFAKGAASFVKKTVFGISDSMTKFTSSVGKGLSAATFDAEYQARRRMNQRRNRPRHALYGVATGGEALASSVSSAVEGVLMKPIEGAEAEGPLGFFKGVGKGLVGVVTKPVIGVFDLASNVSEGIRNTTTVFDNPERERKRLPRHVPHDGVLQPYSHRAAIGQYWMKDLNEGMYRSESYVAHIDTPGGDNVILLTTSRVLSFWSKKLRLEWDLPFTKVKGITVEDTGIRFAHKDGREQDKFALIPDKSSQSWFFNQIAVVVKTFNTRKKMES